MVILVVNTVNRIYSYIKIFCLQNHNALYISQRKAIHNLGFQLYTPPRFAQAKWNLLFGQFIVDGGFFGCAGFNVAASGWAFSCWVLLERVICLGLVVTGEYWTGQLLEQCSQWRKLSDKQDNSFYFSKPGSHLICSAFVMLFNAVAERISQLKWTEMKLIRCCITAQGFVATLIHTKRDEDRAQKWSGHLFLLHACINVAFPRDGGSCNGFSHLKIIHFHQRTTYPAH